MKRFQELTEQEVLALAISLEEDDERFYADCAASLRTTFPASAEMLVTMQAEETEHRRRLTELYKSKFGEYIPNIRRQDIRGFVQRRAIWFMRTRSPKFIREQAAAMELESEHFYEVASKRSNDASIRELLHDLAMIERRHSERAQSLTAELASSGAADAEDAAQHRLFVLQVVQPGLAGLMDGSVSTLAPVFAAATATRNSHEALLVGLAASVGAGISMGFAEALSDDGMLTGRGHPWIRGAVCGAMTMGGGIGHTLPFLIPGFRLAMMVALIVVAVELAVITWVRHRYMETPTFSAAIQVAFGGALVFAVGILIGSS